MFKSDDINVNRNKLTESVELYNECIRYNTNFYDFIVYVILWLKEKTTQVHFLYFFGLEWLDRLLSIKRRKKVYTLQLSRYPQVNTLSKKSKNTLKKKLDLSCFFS